MSGPKRPLKTEAIYRAIRKGGVDIKDAGILYRSINRSTQFQKVGRGLWGLAEWYGGPAAKRRASQTDLGNGAAGSHTDDEEPDIRLNEDGTFNFDPDPSEGDSD
jgi:DNA-directed RNA polymerase delta subunit